MNYDDVSTSTLKLEMHKMFREILGIHIIIPSTLTREQTIEVIERLLTLQELL